MPNDLALSVTIGARLADSFRSVMEQASAALSGIRQEAQKQSTAASAAAKATADLGRASQQAGQAAAGMNTAAAALRQTGASASAVSGQVSDLSRRIDALPGLMRKVDAAFSHSATAAENALAGTAAAADLLARKQKALHDYLQRTNREAGNRSRAEAAMQALSRRQVELKRNEEALARVMERGNALAQQRSRIYADMARLSLQGTALLAPAGMAVSAAAEKQDSIRDIAITGGLDARDEAALSQAVRTIAGQSNQMQTDVLNGMKVLVAGGVQSREELVGFGQELARVATATRASMDDLGSSTLALRDNLGITSKDIGASFNILAAAGKAGLVELKDMAKYLPQMAPALASMGITGNEAVAEMAAALQIARRGAGSNDEAANNMRNYLAKIFAPESVKKFADAGIDHKGSIQQLAKDGLGPFEASVQLVMEYLKSQSPAAAAQFRAAMQEKDNGKQQEMLQRINESYALGDLFGDMQAMNFLRPMIMQMEDYKKIKAESMKAAGQDVIGEDFAKRMQSPLEQWKAMRIEAERVSESLGNALLPAALAVGQSLLPILRSTAQWISENQELVVILAKGAALLLGFRMGLLALRLGFNLLASPLLAAGRGLLAFRALTDTGVGAVQSLFRVLGMSPRAAAIFAGGLGRVGPALRGVGTSALAAGRNLAGALARGFAMAGRAALMLGRALMLNPVGLLVTGIGVAAIAIYKNWDRIRAAFTAGWNWLRNMGPRLLKQGLDMAARILPGAAAVKYVYENWESIKAAMGKGIAWLKALPAQFLQMGAALVSGLVQGIRNGIAAAGEAVAGMAQAVKDKFTSWLGISSPSRIFAEYGLNMAQGAALGIQNGQEAVAGASAALAAATARGWQAPELPGPAITAPAVPQMLQPMPPQPVQPQAEQIRGMEARLTQPPVPQPQMAQPLSVTAPATAMTGVASALPPVMSSVRQAVELVRPEVQSLPAVSQRLEQLRSELPPLPAAPQVIDPLRPALPSLPSTLQRVVLQRSDLPSLAPVSQVIKALRPELPSPAAASQQIQPLRPALPSLPTALQRVDLQRSELPPLPSAVQTVALQRSELSPLGKAVLAPAARRAEPEWTPPRLLTDNDGPARMGAAARGGRQGTQAGSMNISFAPSVTIQGNADAKSVHEGLSLTLEDLKRMLARIAHEKDRRAYV